MHQLTERQAREVDYHRKRAECQDSLLSEPVSYNVIFSPARRWWNQYWEMYTYLLRQDLKNKTVLIVGCGFGDDSLRLAKMGARVFAFDLSPESIILARQLAARDGLDIQFAEMAAERLEYESDFFDCVIARDILHHTDIPLVLREIARVSKREAVLVINEVYSHSLVDRVRRFQAIDRWLYPLLRDFVYDGRDPYITDDERKLDERDVRAIVDGFQHLEAERYFGLIVGRVLPDKYPLVSKIDRLLLIALGPVARLFGSRVILAGRVLN